MDVKYLLTLSQNNAVTRSLPRNGGEFEGVEEEEDEEGEEVDDVVDELSAAKEICSISSVIE